MLRSLLVLAFATIAAAQEFDEASIKPSDPASPEMSWHTSPGIVRIKGMTLKNLVQSAFGVNDYQIAGGPKWLNSDRFDITGKLPAGDPGAASNDPKRFQPALRRLVEQRFRLVTHQEERPVSGYSLVLAKSGLRLKPVEGATGGGYGSSGPAMLSLRNAPMDMLAGALSGILRTPVQNQTGVEGVYDIRLEFAPVSGSEPSEKPSIFTALQEGLGLALKSEKIPIKMLVIDSAEKPEVN